MNDPCEIKPIQKAIADEELSKIQVSYVAIAGLNCHNCATRVRNALLKTYGVIDAIIDHSDGLGEITYNPHLTNPDQIIDVISMAGGDGIHSYSAQIIKGTEAA